MSEYIRKQAVLNLIDDFEFGNAIAADYGNVHEFQKLYDAVRSIPPDDVVEVVRCKDCAGKKACDVWGIYLDDDDFCSHGR